MKTEEVEVLRFSRALFGLTQSPFLLGGTIEQHLLTYSDQEKGVTEEIRRSLYVDDIISDGFNAEEVRELERKTVEIFKDAGFKLHKCHSNVKELENGNLDKRDSEQSFAKQ